MFRNSLVRASSFARALRAQQTRNLASSTVFIGNLPLGTTEATLRPYVEEFGNIYDISLPEPKPHDMTAIGFVKYFVGEIPATVEELARLPRPSADEIEEVTNICARAIDSLNGKEIGSNIIRANHGKKINPDSIQFNARVMVRKANDPEYAQYVSKEAREARRNGSQPNKNGDYMLGYKAGFADGFESCKKGRSQ
ncbi:hypothetical protein GGI07_005779 [Coemansia sp. Benny D115]|nr:hypothetical protein GGI07_005779 [Coemansia sp. Benny D115]